MEYLIVHFPRSRRVKVDDEFNGRTGELIELEAGSHVVTLGPPDNFAPEERRIVVVLGHRRARAPGDRV